MNEEKKLHRIIAQKEGITITATTSHDMTIKEVEESAVASVLGGVDEQVNFKHFIVLPITTEERWNEGAINFCPRCGSNISDFGLDNYTHSDCHDCGASFHVQIDVEIEEDEEDE